ncbi:MAG: PRD domain-containing protein [Erysipelothrix sp.]|nr:PRD domain-containing protein [Erysipelothrix sp.]
MKQRLTILLENHVITQEVYDFVLKIYEGIMKSEDLDGAPSEVFLTHLAMATQRIIDRNIVNEMEEMILNEVKASQYFDEAQRISNLIVEESDISIPESEQQYLWLHLSSALQERGKPRD